MQEDEENAKLKTSKKQKGPQANKKKNKRKKR